MDGAGSSSDDSSNSGCSDDVIVGDWLAATQGGDQQGDAGTGPAHRSMPTRASGQAGLRRVNAQDSMSDDSDGDDSAGGDVGDWLEETGAVEEAVSTSGPSSAPSARSGRSAMRRSSFSKLELAYLDPQVEQAMDALQQVPLLEDLSPEETATVIGCLQFASYCDEHIVRQGEDGDRMFIILEGEAVVTERVPTEDGEGAHDASHRQQRELVRLYEGHYFGELALVCNQPRVASVWAAGKVQCAYITTEAFQRCGEVAQKVQDAAVARMRVRERRESLRASKSLHESVHVVRVSNASNARSTSHLERSKSVEGELVNSYRVTGTLGSGTYGIVRRCTDVRTGQEYAMKVMNKAMLGKRRVGQQDTALQVAIMKKAQHPNVVRLVEVIDDPSYRKIYLVQELVAGGPVHCSGAEPLEQEAARQLFRGMLRGLEYLHAQHIIHRDVKPENILVTADGTAKITDFGVSRTLASDSEMLDEAKGTPAFMAPELLQGATTYDGHAVDLYALGATLYSMVVGRPPFVARTEIALAQRVTGEEVSFPLDPVLDPHLKNLLRRLLAKDPHQRLTLEAAMLHPWVTCEGVEPLPRTMYQVLSVDEEETQRAFTSLAQAFMRTVMLKAKMRRLLARTRDNMRKSAAARREAQGAGVAAPGPGPGPVPAAPTQAGAAGAALAPEAQLVDTAAGVGAPVAPTKAASAVPALSSHEAAVTWVDAAERSGARADARARNEEEGGADATPRDSMGSTMLSGTEGVHEFDAMQDLEWPGAAGSTGGLPAQRDSAEEGGEKAQPPRAGAHRLSWSGHSDASETSVVTTPVERSDARPKGGPGLRRNRSEGGPGDRMRRPRTTRAASCHHHESVGTMALAHETSPGSTVPTSSDSSGTRSLIHRGAVDDGDTPSPTDRGDSGAARHSGSRQLKRKQDFVMVTSSFRRGHDGRPEKQRVLLHAATPAGTLSLATGHSRQSVRRKLRAHVHAVSALTRLQRGSHHAGQGGSDRTAAASAPPGDGAGSDAVEGEGDEPALGDEGQLPDRAPSATGEAGAAAVDEAAGGVATMPRILRRQDGGGGSLLAGNRGSRAAPVHSGEGGALEQVASSSDDSDGSSDEEEDVGEFDEAVEVELDDVDALLDGEDEQPPGEDESLAALTPQEEAALWARWSEAGGSTGRAADWGVHKAQGPRPTMEDTCLCGVRLPATGADATYTGLRVFGVFDGHNGPEVSHWVGQRLAPLLEERGEALAADLPSAMRDAFAAVDNEVLAWCEREGVFSGATATVAVLADKGAGAAPVLVCAGIGDSRAVLCRGGEAVDLTRDHRAAAPEEQARVVEAGGWVHRGRVNGVLAISRSFGDVEFKTLKEKCWAQAFAEDLIVPTPDVREVALQDGDEFAILASDGVWDVLSSQEAVSFVRRLLAGGESCEAAAKALVEKSLALGSKDNTTAAIVDVGARCSTYGIPYGV